MTDTETPSAPPTVPQVLFPGQEAYARQWLQHATTSEGAPQFTWTDETHLDRIAGELSGPGPATVDEQAALAAMPTDVASKLKAKQRTVIPRLRDSYPSLGDEVLTADGVTALATPFGSAAAGSLVYRRETNLGTMLVIDPSHTVDVATGVLRVASPAGALPAAPERAVPAGDAALTVKPKVTAVIDGISTVKSALSALEMVCFACGPQGIVVAAGLAVFGFVLGLGAKANADLPKEINKLIVQDFANDHVKTDLATIVGYADWLSNQDPSAIAEPYSGSLKKHQDALSQLKQYISSVRLKLE
jgi:hypothetical protein